jgi:molybdenum cofactor cytidylyltransferase
MTRIGAVVLAAGMSRRMGRPKVLLPWRPGEIVIQAVVDALLPHASPVLVVGGYRIAEVSRAVTPRGAQVVMNPDYEMGEMLSSFKAGLAALPGDVEAALIALGDQPRIRAETVARLAAAFADAPGGIVVPSYAMRRGHPLIIARRHWGEFMELGQDDAPRTVIERHKAAITYVLCEDDSIIGDIDTPEQYASERAKAGLAAITLTDD